MDITPTLAAADLRPERGNKHHARRSAYNGTVYASRLEAAIAKRLDWLQGPAQAVQAWEYEIRFTLPGLTPKKTRNISHKVDFKVTLTAKGTKATVLYLEAKGQRHRDGETRRAWVEYEYGIEIHIVGSVKEAESVIMEARK